MLINLHLVMLGVPEKPRKYDWDEDHGGGQGRTSFSLLLLSAFVRRSTVLVIPRIPQNERIGKAIQDW